MLLALDHLEPKPFVPPRPAIAAFFAVVVGVTVFSALEGVKDASVGRAKLAAQLFDVEAVDKPPPDFDLPGMGGGRLKLGDIQGRVTLVNFWATWCPPCLEEMPSMLRLAERLKDDPRISFVAISADDGWEPVENLFKSRPKPPFPVLLDQGGRIANTYGTRKFPETWVVVDGVVRGYIIGPRDWDRWYAEQYVREIAAHASDAAHMLDGI